MTHKYLGICVGGVGPGVRWPVTLLLLHGVVAGRLGLRQVEETLHVLARRDPPTRLVLGGGWAGLAQGSTLPGLEGGMAELPLEFLLQGFLLLLLPLSSYIIGRFIFQQDLPEDYRVKLLSPHTEYTSILLYNLAEFLFQNENKFALDKTYQA